MLNTLFAGWSPILDSADWDSILGPEYAASLHAFGEASVVQSGYYTPTQSGDHTFNISTANGSYLAIDGETLVESFSNATLQTNTIVSLVAGQPYSFVYSVPLGGSNNTVNSVSVAVNGGTAQTIQQNQLTAPYGGFSNPLINPAAFLNSIVDSYTPDCVFPIANVMPTNVLANTLIATVPGPAILTSITQDQSNAVLNQIPVPYMRPGGGMGGFGAGGATGYGITRGDVGRGRPVIIDRPGGAGPADPGPITIYVQDVVDTPTTTSVAPTTTANTSSTPVIPAATYKDVNTAPTATYVTPNQPQYIPAHQLSMEITGMIPNTRLSVFFDGVNITTQCAPATPRADRFHNGEGDLDFNLIGNKGDAIRTDANGMAVAVYYLPGGKWSTTAKNIAIFNYTSSGDTYNTKYETHTCSAYTTYGSTQFNSQDNENIAIFATSPTTAKSSANTAGGRLGSITYEVEPMCQTFYVGSDMAQGQDGVFLSSVDLYFSGKSNTQPVSVEIRTTDTNGPTTSALPYSTVTKLSSNVVIAPSAASNSNYATKFNFAKPVFLRAGYTYALAVSPGGQSPDYSLWAATVGKTTTANGAVTSNWGRGVLYTSTTNGSTWNPVQNQVLKFAANRTQHDINYLTNATAVIVNADYEFISFINHSKISFQEGEYVYQKPTAHVAICSVNTSSNTLTLNTTAYGGLTAINPNPLSDFAVNDHIVICGSFPAIDSEGYGRFNYNLFGNAVSLKVLSVGAGGQNLVFGYANGAAITGAPWSNGACYVYKAEPGHVSYSPSSRTVVGTGTRFDIYNNTNERDQTDKRPLIIHAANTTVSRHEVLWPETVTNAASITLKSVPQFAIPTGAMAIPIQAPAAKIVKIDHSRSLIILEKSTANGATGAASAANAYSSPSFFAAGRTLVGTSSGATAIIGGVHDMTVSSAQPVVHTITPQGTAINYSANMATAEYTHVAYPNYSPDSTNYFANNKVIVASRTNEVLKLANNKSIQITARLTSNSTVLSPAIDLLPGAGLLVKSNLINSSAINEHKNNGLAKSKSVSKIVTLSAGNDAEDINVYLTAYKPLGTNLIVYAKVLESTDAEKFEDKDWSILEQVGGVGLYSDAQNQNDYKEFQYSFPRNPITIPSFELVTSNNTANIVSTNSDTRWQQNFKTGQLVTMYSDVYGTNFEVNQIANVNSNTSITLANPVTLANTSSAIIASMPYPYSAFKNSNNGNIVRYYTADGSPHDSFKRFAIKIVFTAQNDYLVPKVRDMRALALSV
jgi:hypothetical protein